MHTFKSHNRDQQCTRADNKLDTRRKRKWLWRKVTVLEEILCQHVLVSSNRQPDLPTSMPIWRSIAYGFDCIYHAISTNVLISETCAERLDSPSYIAGRHSSYRSWCWPRCLQARPLAAPHRFSGCASPPQAGHIGCADATREAGTGRLACRRQAAYARRP